METLNLDEVERIQGQLVDLIAVNQNCCLNSLAIHEKFRDNRSVYPILFYIGNIPIPAWHVLFVAAALAAFMFIQKHRIEAGLDYQTAKQMFVIVYICGYFGARGLSIIVEQTHLHHFPKIIFALFQLGPMTFYGGFIGGFFAALYVVWQRKLNFYQVADVLMVAAMLALAVGRIGCFLNGDDFGKVISSANRPWYGVAFPVLKDDVNGILRYPVQLMESLWAGLFVLGGVFALRKKKHHGIVLGFGLLYYGVGRYFLEFFRGDDRGWIITESLSTSQFISGFIFIGGVFVLFRVLLRVLFRALNGLRQTR